MSGRAWRREPPAGWGCFRDAWMPSFPSGDDMVSAAEKVFFFHPGIGRWCCVGFLNAATPDAYLIVQIGKHRTDMTRTWFKQADVGPSSPSSYARTVFPLMIPDGSTYRLVLSVGRVSAGTQNVLTCSDFGGATSWTARTGPYGSVNYGMQTMVWTGTSIVGGSSGDTRIGRSTNLGNSWSAPYDWGSTVTKVVTNGKGTVLAFSTAGNYIRSTDHGANWSTASLPDWDVLVSFHDCVWALGKFIVLNRDGTAWLSHDGATWEKKTAVIRDPSMETAKPQGRASRNMVACGNMLVAPWGVDAGATYSHWGIMYSLDGYTWHNSGTIGTDFAPATSYVRNVHIASSTPEHAASPYTPFHQLVWYGGDIASTRGMFSPVEWRGVGAPSAYTAHDEAGFE